MRLLPALACALSVAVSCAASAPDKPRPGWPTADYATLTAQIEGAQAIVFDFGNARGTTLVTDPEWIRAFSLVLKEAKAKPASRCFCISRPILRFVSGEREIFGLELTHGSKVRFLGPQLSGDFVIDEVNYEALRQMLVTIKPPSLPPQEKPPAK